jgi:hypothetical protein
MKSYIRTIIVLGVIALLTISSTLAQETPGETATAGIESLQLGAAAPPPVPPLPPPSSFPGAAAGEVDVATSFELAEEPPRGAYTYVNVAPGTAGRSSSSSRKVLVIPDFFGRGSRATEAVYLQGYGVLFLMEVNIPLSSPPKAKEQDKDESATKADSVWKQAQQEIFQPSVYRNKRVLNSAEIYDAEKVEELKSRLIKALKHAANMKNLEPDELIILTVIGKGRSYPGGVYSYGRTGGGGYSSGLSEYEGVGAANVRRSYSRTGRNPYSVTRSTRGGTGSASSTVLTIRAKKSDIDAFAKGDLDYDKFREKVQILTYPSLGQQVVHRLRTRRPGGQDTTTAVPVLPPRGNNR